MKHIGMCPGASVNPMLVLAAFFFILNIIGCSGSSNMVSGSMPDNTLIPPEPTPTPVIPPDETEAEPPEIIASKQILEEVENIQQEANSNPEMILSSEDIELLQQEGLLEDKELLNGWVQ